MTIYQKDINRKTLKHTVLRNISWPIFEVFFQILLDVNLSLNKTLLTFTIDSNSFSVKGYLPLIQKDSVTLVCLVLHGLRFAKDLSLGNSSDFYICFWQALLYSLFCFFFLNWSPSLSLCTVFDAIDKLELSDKVSMNLLFLYPSSVLW